MIISKMLYGITCGRHHDLIDVLERDHFHALEWLIMSVVMMRLFQPIPVVKCMRKKSTAENDLRPQTVEGSIRGLLFDPYG